MSEAINKNSKIPANARCLHELAVLRVKMKEKAQLWRAHSYVSKGDEQRVHQQIVEWLKNGTIEQDPESSMYCLPIVCAPKKDDEGNKVDVRPCLDCRFLNKVIEEIEYFWIRYFRIRF